MKNKTKIRQIVVFWVLYLCYTSIYIARLNLSVAADSTGLSTAQLGLLGSVFSVVYAVGRMFNGALGDRVKPYVMICSGLLIAGGGNIAVSFLPPFPAFLVLWGLNAYGQSMIWSSILCVMVQEYGDGASRRTAPMVTSVATGNIAGILVTSLILSYLDPRWAFILPGAFTVLCAIAAFAVTRGIDRVGGNDAPKTEKVGFRTFAKSAFRLLTVRDVLIMAIPAVIHGTMKDNISLFMVKYFIDAFKVDPAQNPLYILFIPVVGLLGRTAYPACKRLCGNSDNRTTAAAFAVSAVMAGLLLSGICTAVTATVCLSVIYAMMSVINTNLLSIFPLRFAKSGNVSSVSGLMDFITYASHGISSAIFGITVSGALGWNSMFLVWAVLSAVALLIMIRVNHPKEKIGGENNG